MKTTSNDKFTTLTAEKDFEYFLNFLKTAYDPLTAGNLVLDLSNIQTTENQINELAQYAEAQAENNNSFVIVIPTFDADVFDEELNVVPTLTEAEDIIDMDEMTRDLGF
ncbi:ribonuclease Z [Wenyingzhuangia sp. IMCC45533]